MNRKERKKEEGRRKKEEGGSCKICDLRAGCDVSGIAYDEAVPVRVGRNRLHPRTVQPVQSDLAWPKSGVCRSRSDPDLVAKFGTVIEETDESAFWLEFSALDGLIRLGDERSLLGEANELVAIFMQGRKTARQRLR